jgi:hypothetical protein
MPKQPIDYSRTFAYMLCCKDPTITDVYVGHTTNLTKRKTHHKALCNNANNNTDQKYHRYVYRFLRENGGWNNWEMIVLETKSCIDGKDARKFEREWFEKKGATLNKARPIISREEELLADRQYHRDHQDEKKEYDKIYYQKNTDKKKKYQKIYCQEHREEISERQKKYHEEHKDEWREYKKIYNKKYRQENKDEINRKCRERYALKKLQKETEVNLSV